MQGDEKEPLFVFRPRSAYLRNDSSQDIQADIERVSEMVFFVIDDEGRRHQLPKAEYVLFNNTDLQYLLVDVHTNQSRWLLIDNWKRHGEEGYEIASYVGDAIGEATDTAKRLNATTIWPTLDQAIERVSQIMEEVRRYQQGER